MDNQRLQIISGCLEKIIAFNFVQDLFSSQGVIIIEVPIGK